MTKIETGKTEKTPSARVLRDDELNAVNGGFSRVIRDGKLTDGEYYR